MKQLTCEMCGSTDLIKDGGLFICQTCGTKYSVEEAKKMMIDGIVDVKIDRSREVENLLKNADNSFEDKNHKAAFDLYSSALNIDPDNPHAILYRAISSTWQSTVADCRILELDSASKRAFKLMHEQAGDTQEYFSFVDDAMTKLLPCINAIDDMYHSYYNKAKPRTGLSISLAIMTADLTAQVENTLKLGVKNCSIVSQNLVTYALDNVSDFGEATEVFWKDLEIAITNAKTYIEGLPTIYLKNSMINEVTPINKRIGEIQSLRIKWQKEKDGVNNENLQETDNVEQNSESEQSNEEQKEVNDEIVNESNKKLDSQTNVVPTQTAVENTNVVPQNKVESDNNTPVTKNDDVVSVNNTQTNTNSTPANTNNNAKENKKGSPASIILGVFGILAAWTAILGQILSIIGIVLGVKENKKTSKKAGLIISIIGEVFSVIFTLIYLLLILGSSAS